jgi:GNAT superfamily N-acetyltransferase
VSTFRVSREHAEVVASLLHGFNTEFGAPVPGVGELSRRFAALLERDDVLVFVGGTPEVPLGFALVTLRPSPYYDGPVAALDEMYVLPDSRGKGLGGELMTTILGELRKLRCGEVQINVDEPDADARRLYEAHGFTNIQPGTDERMLCYLTEL